MRPRPHLIFATALLAPLTAHAQDAPPDIGQIAGFIRWGGVFLSLFVIAGAAVVLRLISSAATKLSERFSNRRMLIQKLESMVRALAGGAR